MLPIKDQLSALVSDAFERCGYDRALGVVQVSARPDLCQFQCNGAMAAAKRYRKAPALIAGEVAACLQDVDCLAKAEVAAPGFLNLTLTDEALKQAVEAMLSEERFGIPGAEKDECIVVDYGGPNVAKPLHVGHLRAAVIGEAIKRLAKALGYRTVGDVHLGDWGLQMGLVIAKLAQEQPELCYFDPQYEGEYPAEPPVTLADLSRLYPEASALSKVDKEFYATAAQATFDLQNGRRGYMALWKHLTALSVADLKKNYANICVDFDVWYGESDSDPYIAPMLEDLISRGLAREDDGALVMDVAREDDASPMPPALIRKSDGSCLYVTTDMATICQRMKDFKPDQILYVVDNRQSLHFEQVFRAVRQAGYADESVKLEFCGFGTMNGKDGKPYKTRDGGVMRLSDLIALITEAALAKITEAGFSDFDEAEKQEVARKVGVAALKYGDLMNQRSKDYVFDLDKFLSFEGKTGPYLLYTVVRINSLLAKAEAAGAKPSALLAPQSETERALMLRAALTSYPLWQAMREKAPNVVCDNAYETAALLNKFYNETRIIACEDEAQRGSWLTLLAFVRDLLRFQLDVLGIPVPERM
ncbi:MAG: arginine--tRNA ligase [Clostridia bacterium]|nr:arginine--tRNA ligase [Clostridia bacterium]